MRGKPQPTEKRVGAVVLVLTGSIVLIFLLTGGLLQEWVNRSPLLVRAKNLLGISEKPLFTADPQNLPAPPAPHQVRVARFLLPDSLGTDTPGQGDVQTFALRGAPEAQAAETAGLEPEFIEAMQSLNARWVYVRAYGAKNPHRTRVQVVDLGDPASASKACETRTPEGHRALPVGRGGWVADSRAGFWSGRYYTEITTSQGQSLETVARSLSGLQLSYGGLLNETAPSAVAQAGPAVPPETKGPGRARFAEVPGGRLIAPTKIERYAENLYEKINGKESAFRSFFVVDLKFGQYADPESQQTYDVYIYDMAAPVNAMGIYMSERAPEVAVMDLGREGYASGTSVFFWKGQYYVNVLGPPEGGDAALSDSKQIGAAVAESIADDGEPFWADKLLPAEDRVPNSLSYQASSALGYEFLQRMFFARYDVGGKKLQMFITRAADPAGARSIYDRFAESTARYDKVVAREDLNGGQLFVSETVMPGRPSKFGAAFSKGPYFGGVYDGDDQGAVVAKAKLLFDGLSAGDAGDPAAAVTSESSSDEEDSSHGEPIEGEAGESESSQGESQSEEQSSEETESGY